MSIDFQIHANCPHSQARYAHFTCKHGRVETPIFMPVGTRAAVKGMTHQQLCEVSSQIILGNTYHLLLRPGKEIIRQAGGLHAFMSWDLPILTDSGGYQVFSLSDLNQVTDKGVSFRSHLDGSQVFMGPKESMEMQKILGSDIVMAFDECPPYPCSYEKAALSWKRSHAWAKECRDYPLDSGQNLFGIVQGGVYEDLRKKSAQDLQDLDFDGYAIGGLSVGEPADMMYTVLDGLMDHLPKEKPRYLMGVGTPRNIIEAVMRGVDMFDCVMPTRNARNATAFTWQGKLSMKTARYARDFSPLDPELDSYASKFSKAYIRHLLNVDEMTGKTLLSMQNVAFYLDLMQKIRQAIANQTLADLYQKVIRLYPK